MKSSLFMQAISKFLLGMILVGVLIFLPAGTVNYPGGWRLMLILFVPMFLAGLVMLAKNPGLLESRLKARETQAKQGLIVKLSGLMFLVGFVVAGLDFRYGWFELPGWMSRFGTAVFLNSYLLYAEVLRENTWLSRTIGVHEGQKVVDTGLYGVIRHPMYSATVLLFLSMPLVLGSLWSFVVFLAYPFLIVERIYNEEEVLRKELRGYEEYMKKVRYRMIPFVW